MRYSRTAIGLLSAQYRSVLRKCFLINAGLFMLAAPAVAAVGDVVEGTLTTINAEAINFLDSTHGSYSLSELGSETLPDGAVSVTIDGTKYYYTPNEGDNAVLLQNLANIGGSALGELTEANKDKALYRVDGKYYGYDTTKLPASGYELKEVAAKSDKTVTLYQKNADNTLTPVYYEVVLQQTEYGTGNRVKYYVWKKNADGNYEFTNVTDETNANITTRYDTSNQLRRIENSNATIGNITGDFIGNYVSGGSSARGGAIFNYARGATATIGNITGDFIGNYASSTSSYANGGAIFNYAESAGTTATIGNITGDFIGNYASSTYSYAYGGAILNYTTSAGATATIGNITGDFIGNYAIGPSAYGGAICNYARSGATATIGNITGNFIGNYASSASYYARGGAINNSAYYQSATATIGNITGDFIGNYASSTSSTANGGAIFNYADPGTTATIGNITGDFIGNYQFHHRRFYPKLCHWENPRQCRCGKQQ